MSNVRRFLGPSQCRCTVPSALRCTALDGRCACRYRSCAVSRPGVADDMATVCEADSAAVARLRQGCHCTPSVALGVVDAVSTAIHARVAVNVMVWQQAAADDCERAERARKDRERAEDRAEEHARDWTSSAFRCRSPAWRSAEERSAAQSRSAPQRGALQTAEAPGLVRIR
jgi:hypothetical protein